ncbi:hypothetical protein S245_036341, partial [Arachis hypogaea]
KVHQHGGKCQTTRAELATWAFPLCKKEGKRAQEERRTRSRQAKEISLLYSSKGFHGG